MTTPAPSFHPPWAVTCWVDDTAVYIEIPTKAEPYITNFPLSESGLSKALHFLKTIHRQKTGGGKVNGKTTQHSLLKKAKAPEVPTTTERQEKARSVLRKLGMI